MRSKNENTPLPTPPSPTKTLSKTHNYQTLSHSPTHCVSLSPKTNNNLQKKKLLSKNRLPPPPTPRQTRISCSETSETRETVCNRTLQHHCFDHRRLEFVERCREHRRSAIRSAAPLLRPLAPMNVVEIPGVRTSFAIFCCSGELVLHFGRPARLVSEGTGAICIFPSRVSRLFSVRSLRRSKPGCRPCAFGVQVAALESLHSAALESLLSGFQARREAAALESLHSQSEVPKPIRGTFHQCDFVRVFPN